MSKGIGQLAQLVAASILAMGITQPVGAKERSRATAHVKGERQSHSAPVKAKERNGSAGAKAKESSRSASRAKRHAGGLSKRERSELLHGRTVSRAFAFTRNGASYQAGMSYRMVDADPQDVVSWLRRPGALEQALPHARHARLLEERDAVSTIRVFHQRGPIQGQYTVRLAWDVQAGHGRFWLDPSRSHDLRDLWGFFRVQPVGPDLSLITFAFAFDLGGLGELVEPAVRDAVLSVPRRIAEGVAPPFREQVVGEGEERYE